MTWNTLTGSRVELTILTEDKKVVTLRGRVAAGKPNRVGPITRVVEGVTYLDELDTWDARFVLENHLAASK